MTNSERLITELVFYANGATLRSIEENLAVDENGELIRHIAAVGVKNIIEGEIRVEFTIDDL